MGLTTVGINFLAGALMGDEATLFNETNSYLGVGDSTTAFAVGQTDLQAASNKVRKAQEVGYPTRDPGGAGDNVLRYRSSFGAAEANFDWEEWGLFNAASAGSMFSRKVVSLGTKSSGSTWVLEVDLTFSIGS